MAISMAASGSSGTLYSQLISIRPISDYTPSRITRPSSNAYLQEHDPLSNLFGAASTDLGAAKPRTRSDAHVASVVGLCSARDRAATNRAVPLKGRYVEIGFADSFPSQARVGAVQVFQDDEEFTGSRAHSRSEPPLPSCCRTSAYPYPLCLRSRADYKRAAIRRRNQTLNVVDDTAITCSMSDAATCTASFVAKEVAEARMCSSVGQVHLPSQPAPASPRGIPVVTKIKVKRQRFSPPREPPPPPPPPYGGSFLTRMRLESGAGDLQRGEVPDRSGSDALAPQVAEVGPESMPSEASSSEGYVSLHLRPVQEGKVDIESLVSTNAFSQLAREESDGREDEEREIGSSAAPPRSPPRHRYVNIDEIGSPLSNRSDSDEVPTPLGQTHGHHTPSPMFSPSPELPPSPLDDSICPAPLSPSQLPHTKPVPPPRRSSQETLRCLSESRVVQSAQSVSNVRHPQALRSRSVSFLQCSAGDELGTYLADYLGSGQTDCYLNSVDHVAKQLVESKPVEVVTYVTSERVRLAPPNNSALLFKSFAMKDILMVQRCSKNKRILGIVLWKSCNAVPICHVLRCGDQLMANSLHEAIWVQSQSVDDVTLSKVSRHQLRPLSDISSSGGSSTISSEVDHASSVAPPHVTPISPSELLHKLPAVHIGSAAAGKLHSVNEVIQKVLSESRPSQAKEVSVWLSVAQVRLVDVSEPDEVIYATHETSRIRAIGVYSLDKRFIGYIIKEGKPLTGYVLRCNSAALMVSLVSFLRQSCQMTFHQRGGSFYDELSADDSEDLDGSEGSTGRDSPGILRRLRSLTLTTPKPISNPSFVAHTPLLREHTTATTDPPPSKRDSIRNTVLSPLDFCEDEYAKFSVNYVGSGTLSPPMTQQCVIDALELFTEEGMAKGQAAVPKNVIHMQVSALGINLSDRKHQLFVNRNYPRNQVVGYCIHPQDPKYFAFGSQKPGFPDSIKCHVFKQLQEPTEQILEAIKFWLEFDPILS